jgi:uncharacterized protein
VFCPADTPRNGLPVNTDEGIRELLDPNTDAFVGCSSTPSKAAHEIPKYLQEQGYEVVPVNPNADKVLGRPAYDSLSEIEAKIDLGDVFRPAKSWPALSTPCSFVTISMSSDSNSGSTTTPVSRTEAAGLQVVHERYIKPKRQRFVAALYSPIRRISKERARDGTAVRARAGTDSRRKETARVVDLVTESARVINRLANGGRAPVQGGTDYR